jgi:CheY-like chemotaxis protein
MPTILIVEDEEQIRTSYVEILELEGFEAYGAENGMVGLDVIAQVSIDVVVCDLVMPRMDGYEMLGVLRQNAETADIPFILVTAKTDQPTRDDFIALGVNAILAKPVRLEELLATIREWL